MSHLRPAEPGSPRDDWAVYLAHQARTLNHLLNKSLTELTLTDREARELADIANKLRSLSAHISQGIGR